MKARPFSLLLATVMTLAFVLGQAAWAQEIVLPSGGDNASFVARISAAVANHPTVMAEIAAHRETRQARREIFAAYLPQVDFNLSGDASLARSFEDEFDNIVERSRPRARANATLSGNQLLFDAGATSARLSSADARIAVSEAQVLSVTGSVAIETIAAHHQVILYRALLNIGRDYVARHRELLSQTRERYDEGVGALRDVARVEARLADAEARLAQFEIGLSEAESRYQELFGEAPDSLTLPEGFASEAHDLDAAQLLGIGQNPAVKASSAGARAAEQDYRAQQAANLPNLSLAVDATKFDLLEDREDYDIRGRVVMRYNLYSGGAQSARVAQALQRWRQAEHDQDRVRQEVERDIAIAWREYEVLARQRSVLQRAADANKRARDIYLEQFRVARGSLIDMLQVEEEYFAAQTTYLNGIIEAEMAQYRLLAQTGEILSRLDLEFSFASAEDLFGQR